MRGAAPVLSCIGLLQLRDVELFHRHEGLEHAVDLGLVLVEQHLRKDAGRHLPRQTEPVLEPAALAFLTTTLAQLAPEVIDLFLVFAKHLKRDRFGELEQGPAIEREEFLAFELELDCQHRAWLATMNFLPLLAVVRGAADLRVIENRGIKLRCLLGLLVVPEAWCDFLFCDCHNGHYSFRRYALTTR